MPPAGNSPLERPGKAFKLTTAVNSRGTQITARKTVWYKNLFLCDNSRVLVSQEGAEGISRIGIATDVSEIESAK
jgi:hypothetical protein